LLHWLPWKYRKGLLLIINIVQTLVVGIFLFEMVRNTLVAYRTQEAVAGTVQLPIWPIKILIVIEVVL
jgi:TRAP-type mannitol/chloroaromatic compound transport system permease small subunit